MCIRDRDRVAVWVCAAFRACYLRLALGKWLTTARGYQAGRTFLLDRARLLEALKSLESREDYTAEKRRRERLRDVVEASREHLILTRVQIPVRAAAVRPSLDRLAPGVLLLPGILSIEFRHPIELLEKLYGLAQALTHDFEKFEGSYLRTENR